MRICYLSRDYPTELNFGGIASYIKDTADYLTKLGHEVHVICQSAHKTNDYKDTKIFVHAIKPIFFWKGYLQKVGIGRLIEYFFGRLMHSWSFNIPCYLKFKKINSERKFDLIESEDGAGIALLLTLNKKLKIITKFHTPWTLTDILNGYYRNSFDCIINKIIEREQFLRSKSLNANSYCLKNKINELFKLPKKKIDVLYYGINMSRIKKYRKIKQRTIKGDYIIYFGRIEERKGIRTLADSMQFVFKQNKKIKFVFVGDEPDYSKGLKNYIIKKNKFYSKNIIFIKNLKKEKLFPIIAGARLVVLPSQWEAFGYTCLEAMCLGCVVLASRGSGFEEQIQKDGKNGFLFTPKDHIELGKKIIQIINMPKRQLDKIRNNAKKRATYFDHNDTTKKLLSYYKKIIKR